MFIDWIPFSSSSVLMIIMHTAAFVQTSLAEYCVAPTQKYLNTIQLSCHVGGSGNTTKNIRKVKLMHLI